MVLRSWNPFAECGGGAASVNQSQTWAGCGAPPAAWGTQAFGTGCRVGQREFTEGEPWPSAFSGPLCLLLSSGLALGLAAAVPPPDSAPGPALPSSNT